MTKKNKLWHTQRKLTFSQFREEVQQSAHRGSSGKPPAQNSDLHEVKQQS